MISRTSWCEVTVLGEPVPEGLHVKTKDGKLEPISGIVLPAGEWLSDMLREYCAKNDCSVVFVHTTPVDCELDIPEGAVQ